MPENEDAARIYQLTQGQVRMVFNGEVDKPFALDHTAVWNDINHAVPKIQDPWKCFLLVDATFHHLLDKDNE